VLSPSALLQGRNYAPSLDDPTFGKTDIGATEYTEWGGYLIACRYQMGAEDGIAESISLYIRNVGTEFRVGIYIDDAGTPAALLTQGGPAIAAGPAWHTVSVTEANLTANAYYWLAFLANNPLEVNYDPGYANQKAWKPQPYGPLPDPYTTPSGYDPMAVSIYCTYRVPAPPGVKAMFGGLYLVYPA